MKKHDKPEEPKVKEGEATTQTDAPADPPTDKKDPKTPPPAPVTEP